MTEQNPLATYSPKISASLVNLSNIIRGKDDVLKDAMTCMIAGGHLLIEDIPGVGKTTLAYGLAKIAGGSFSRIQFTNDLLPSDILGVSIYEQNTNSFDFHEGPIFANFVLADEINRTTPKTQSSLLECMERSQISIDGKTLTLPYPFMVIATQNPIDFEGTFPLPENQLDRFLMRISMGYPSIKMEKAILEHPNHHYDQLDIQSVLDLQDLRQLQHQVSKIFVEESIIDYMLNWVQATRENKHFRLGISTRGAIALKKVSQARALVGNRDYVIPEDVEQSINTVFSHRIITHDTYNGALEDRSIIESELEATSNRLERP